MSGFRTLTYKEMLRFTKVSFQTIAAPVINAMLYLLIFAHVLSEHIRVYDDVPYSAFLVPGLAMMSTMQNAFANSSSSIVQSKMTGNIVFILLAPLTYFEFFCAYVCACVARGLLVGVGITLVAAVFVPLHFAHPLWIVLFGMMAAAILGALGLVAGIWADKVDQLAGFQNFLITPLTFLSGVFYSIHSLPAFWQRLSQFNPFFYMIDGFRYGFFGQSDVSPLVSFAVVIVALATVSGIALGMLKTGYKLRH